MPKFAPVLRIGLVIFGSLLVIGAFVGVLTLGAGTHPPSLHIAVAARDIAQGERLTASDYRIVEQILDPSLARLYVQEGELSQFTGAYVVETLRKGDPVNKVKLAAGNTAAALTRYSLSLDDPNFVIMNLPVNPDIIPSKISQGDFVNILFAGGAENSINQLPLPIASLSPEVLPVALDVPPLPEPAAGSGAGPDEEPDVSIEATPDTAMLLPTPTVTATPEIVLPLADLMLERVEILDVSYQQVQNSGYGGEGPDSDQPYLNGPISAIVVKVPCSHQTLLMFGASMSKLRFALTSPRLSAQALQPQMGMDWGKYVALYRWKESQVSARGETVTQTLYPDVEPMAAGVPVTPAQPLASTSVPMFSPTPAPTFTPPSVETQPIAP